MKKQYIAAAFKAGSRLAMATVLASTIVQVASAHDSPKREGFNEPFILSHLKQLKIVVGKLDAYATEHGESEDNVKRILTDGLAPTHISITDSAAGNSKECGPSDTPLLYLKVKVIPDGGASKGAACSVSLALVEKAKITRNKRDLMVSVWTGESVGRLGDNVKETIDQQVEGVFKDFHRDYLLANSADSSKDVPDDSMGKSNKKHKAPK